MVQGKGATEDETFVIKQEKLNDDTIPIAVMRGIKAEICSKTTSRFGDVEVLAGSRDRMVEDASNIAARKDQKDNQQNILQRSVRADVIAADRPLVEQGGGSMDFQQDIGKRGRTNAMMLLSQPHC